MQHDYDRSSISDDWISKFGLRAAPIKRQKNQSLYSQGDRADTLFQIQSGHIKLTVLSGAGKEAVIAILGPGEFFGETCLAAQPFRHSSAIAVTKCVVLAIDRNEMARNIKRQPALAEFLLSHVLWRNVQLESDLVDQLCNSCEKRLARTLLLLTHSEPGSDSTAALPKINQETLAAMVGTTQPRISFLLNKFKERGLIEYRQGLQVNSSLAKLFLQGGNSRGRSGTAGSFTGFALSNSE